MRLQVVASLFSLRDPAEGLDTRTNLTPIKPKHIPTR